MTDGIRNIQMIWDDFEEIADSQSLFLRVECLSSKKKNRTSQSSDQIRCHPIHRNPNDGWIQSMSNSAMTNAPCVSSCSSARLQTLHCLQQRQSAVACAVADVAHLVIALVVLRCSLTLVLLQMQQISQCQWLLMMMTVQQAASSFWCLVSLASAPYHSTHQLHARLSTGAARRMVDAARECEHHTK